MTEDERAAAMAAYVTALEEYRAAKHQEFEVRKMLNKAVALTAAKLDLLGVAAARVGPEVDG